MSTELPQPHEHERWHSTWLGSDRLLARNLALPVARFLRIEAAAGVLLLVGALIAVIWANSGASSSYTQLWSTEAGLAVGDFSLEMSLHEWVNDGLMALFFFVAGMEIKRELISGELRDPKVAALPVIAALGGMLVPALLYVSFNQGGAGAHGWGIPMATDIAFAVGIVSLLGAKVPPQLKLFLLSLAVADDLGAIGVIALVYSRGIVVRWVALAVALFVLTYALRRMRVWWTPAYVALGVFAWYATLRSGVHATVAGVVMGFLAPMTPLRDRFDVESIADRLENQPELTAADVRSAAFHIREAVPVGERFTDLLHPWTGFVIIPLFALANAGIPLSGDVLSDAATSSVTLGVAIGLLVGKTVGVCGASYVAVRLGIARLPRGARFPQMVGISIAAGIGFTVSIFVAGLAFDDAAIQDQAKVGIFASSFAAAVLSAIVLSLAARHVDATEMALEQAEDAALFAEERRTQLDTG